MSGQLRILLVQASEPDAELILNALERGGLDAASVTLGTRGEIAQALEDYRWDAIVCEADLPGAPASTVLQIMSEKGVKAPLIVVGRRVSADAAVTLMLAGAFDFVPREHLALLPAAVERGLAMAKERSGRERAEKALRRQVVLYETFLQAQSDLGQGVFILDGPGIAYANDAFARITGYAWQELTALPSFLDLVLPEERERVLTRLKRCLTGDERMDHDETVLVRKDGHPVNVAMSVKPIDVDGRSQLLAVVQDVTAQKHAELELAATRNSVLAAEKLSALGSLATGVTHEINTPLTYMLTSAEMTRLELSRLLDRGELPDEIRGVLERLLKHTGSTQRGIDRISRVIASLTQVSLAGQGHRNVLDVNALTESVLTVARPRLEAGVHLKTSYGAGAPVVMPEGELAHVLVSLVLAAAKAMEGQRDGVLSVRTFEEDEKFRIEISDTGPERRILVEPHTPTDLTDGTVSLVASRRLIERHGGRLDVTTSAIGTTVIVDLPVDRNAHMEPRDATRTVRR